MSGGGTAHAGTVRPGVGDVPWVLSNARRHARDPRLRTAAGFARAFGDPPPHRARVSRWEAGRATVTHPVVDGYEQVLGLPPGLLQRAIDLLHRDARPVSSLPSLPLPVPDDLVTQAMPLLEQALQYEPMTGADWDRLTTLLGQATHVLVRERDWESLVYRVSVEASVRTGLEYAQRWEASARLVSLPRSTDVVIEMIESALKDDEVQLYSDYATLLRYSPDRRGHEVLADVILRPTNPRALWASLSTLTTLVRHHTVDPALVSALLPRAVETLTDESVPLRTRRAAASLAQRADGYADDGRGRSLTLGAAERRTVDALLETSGLRSEQQQVTLTRVRTDLERAFPADGSDPVLEALLRTALCEPHLDTRDTALAVLLLSPQGPVVGEALHADLVEALAANDAVGVRAQLSLLSWLVEPVSLDLLTALSTDRSLPSEVTGAAGGALGNCPEPAGAARRARDATLFGYARERILTEREDRSLPAGNAWGVGYALGMRGRFDLIEALVALPQSRGNRAWNTSLGWWLGLHEVVRPASTA